MSGRVAGWGISILLATLALSAPGANAAVGSISAGQEHTCALKTGGAAICWGSSAKGQTTAPAGSLAQIAAGGFHTCAVKTDGTPVCWGDNSVGQTGTDGIGTVTQVTAGVAHTCAIQTGGTPVCRGLNDDVQTTIPPGTGTVTQISAGGFHTCAIKADGSPACWGWNDFGQTTIPPAVGTVSQISAGLRHTCAIKTADGTPVCWGDDSEGQTSLPAGIGTVTQISAGGLHTCAIKTGGTPVCWGLDDHGQSTVPAGIGTVTQIAVGFMHTCAIRSAGPAVCWGDNGSGQRGTPPAITSGPPPATASAKPYSHTVTTTGSLGPTLAVTSGALPPGLSLAGGKITGTPTASGVFTGTIRASDGVFADATQSFSIAVDIVPPAIAISAPANGATYVKGRQVLAAYACSDPCTGPVRVGVPIDTQTVGRHTFTVTARDRAGNATTRSVGYTVAEPPDTVGPVVTIPSRNRSLAVSRRGVVLFRLGKALEPTTGSIALKAMSLKLGRASFRAASGSAATVRIKLSAKARKTLAKRGRLKATARIAVRDSAGNATVKTYRLTLKRRR